MFSFIKGGENVVAVEGDIPFDWDAAASTVRSGLTDAMHARNLSFLFGSGCSSTYANHQQVGIPTMAPMASSFLGQIGADAASPYITQPERDALQAWMGLNLEDAQYSRNLERLMESLYGTRLGLRGANEGNPAAFAMTLDTVISKVARHVLASCADGPFAHGDDTVLRLYEEFYRKLIFRDRNLPRPWVFTTNYDLFNERAMDRRGIPFCNGFSGVIERRFNPAVFRYSLAEQLDITSGKWTAVDSFVYLCKLHGSVNWVEDGQTLFPVRELAQTPSGDDARVLIYPTPAKQSASFASPYADLFREFQGRIVRDQSVLITVGYSFGDEHINNIIFQGLTLANFRLIAFIGSDTLGVPAALRDLSDPRIWMIGSDMLADRSAHYFDTFVREFMPNLPDGKVESAVAKVLSTLIAGVPGEGANNAGG